MMKQNTTYLLLFIILILSSNLCDGQDLKKKNKARIADKPLFIDTIYDGAADPTIIYNHIKKSWYLFYTNRRANQVDSDGKDVSWVHGTPIGIAESTDNGASWHYIQNAVFNYGDDSTTFWAPEITFHQETYHMYVSIVPGIFKDWKHPREIVHFTSKDLIHWEYKSELKLATDKVIDACVMQIADTLWRLWYNNEKDGKSTYYAESNDLYHWTDKGKANLIGNQRGEGPNVFLWKGTYYMIIDEWKGLGVYSSNDALNWERQSERILDIPGKGEQDNVIGQHADVLINKNQAYIFYFTHPGRSNPQSSAYEKARSVIQIAALNIQNGLISCNRDNNVYISLSKPNN